MLSTMSSIGTVCLFPVRGVLINEVLQPGFALCLLLANFFRLLAASARRTLNTRRGSGCTRRTRLEGSKLQRKIEMNEVDFK